MKIDFYLIKLIRPDGTRGFVCQQSGKMMVTNTPAAATQFTSPESVKLFIREHKLERKGVNAICYSNVELITSGELTELGGKPLYKTSYYLETPDGKKCCYNTNEDGYYFRQCEAGYCAWETHDQLLPLQQAFLEDGIVCEIKHIDPK